MLNNFEETVFASIENDPDEVRMPPGAAFR